MMVAECISQVHLLEQVSSTENSIGTLAEKLLEALRDNTECDRKVNNIYLLLFTCSCCCLHVFVVYIYLLFTFICCLLFCLDTGG